jgi:hypothetical protein
MEKENGNIAVVQVSLYSLFTTTLRGPSGPKLAIKKRTHGPRSVVPRGTRDPDETL